MEFAKKYGISGQRELIHARSRRGPARMSDLGRQLDFVFRVRGS